MTPRVKTTIISAAFAVVAILAVIGWARTPAPAPSFAGAQVAWDTSMPAVQASGPVSAAPGTRAVYGGEQPEAYRESATANPCVQPVAYASPAPSYAERYSVRTVRPRTVAAPERLRTYEERPVVRHGRSTKKSAAIVAGSAGFGAAIGALAGGGKGAAIGALAGGGSGFVYDRLTHNR